MINKEEFLKLVNSSIQYNNGTPYLILNDSIMICPFCQKEILMKNNQLQCSCEVSINFKERYNSLRKEFEEKKLEFVLLEKEVKYASLSFFKKHFYEVIMPQLKEEFNKNIEDILNIKDET
jgi:hypothetical protein